MTLNAFQIQRQEELNVLRFMFWTMEKCLNLILALMTIISMEEFLHQYVSMIHLSSTSTNYSSMGTSIKNARKPMFLLRWILTKTFCN